MKIKQVGEVFGRWLDQFSTGGIVVGVVLASLSLTPSLLPRGPLVQGLLSGCVLAVGYGIGATLQWLWNWLELRLPSDRVARRTRTVLLVMCALMLVYFLFSATAWQNSIRAVMDMAPVENSHPLQVALIALLLASALIFLGTLLVRGVSFASRRLSAVVPRRVAFLAGIVVVTAATAFLINGVLVRWALHTADEFYAQLDRLAGQYETPPTDPLRSGSASSLIDWDTIGRDARIYVQSGPTAEQIEAVIGRPATDPLRVYVGLRSAATAEERAQLALAEMLRVGAFDREILILIMPVGTGWVDPVGIDTVEMLHAGDVASVALQYSYLTSWISLVAEPDVGAAEAQALFTTVHEHWTKLSRENRPKLYLHGMSLGAYASESSARIYDVLADPFNGALWVGPPFASPGWRQAVSGREEGSPAWLPRVGNSSTIRFTSQDNALDIPGAQWGPVRIVYLQYASDPIVFFDPDAWYRPPAWLRGRRGADVSPMLDWFPIVTFLQLSFDLTLAQTSPIGYGHVYAPQHYLDAWFAVTEPEGWTADTFAALKRRLTRTGELADIHGEWFMSAAGSLADVK